METVIIILQIVCVAGLALGTALSLYEIMQRSGREAKHFDYAAANDFEIDFRRVARSHG
jgi:phosphate/sulfate permease